MPERAPLRACNQGGRQGALLALSFHIHPLQTLTTHSIPLQDNALVRWCPSVPHCGRAIRVAGEVHCEPECACGQRFCFACALEPHSPCTCDM